MLTKLFLLGLSKKQEIFGNFGFLLNSYRFLLSTSEASNFSPSFAVNLASFSDSYLWFTKKQPQFSDDFNDGVNVCRISHLASLLASKSLSKSALVKPLWFRLDAPKWN
jgi:hypothetical protein